MTTKTYTVIFFVFALFFCQSVVIAEPVTLYKSANIVTAKENINRHEWAREIVDRWERSVAFTLKQDRTFFEDMIDPLTPWPLYGQSCPACVGRLSTMGETGLYEWDIREPDKLRCKYCGTVYPNEDFPETGSITCTRMGQTFTFYETEAERAHPDDTSGKHAFRWASWPVHTSFSGILRYRRASWCANQVLPLAKLYALTGEIRYAEKAAEILDVLALRYPGWLFHSYNGTYADCPPAEAAAELGRHPRAGQFPIETIVTAFPGLHTRDGYATLNNGFWGAGRYGCSGSDGGFILNMAVAYDLIHEARHADGTTVIAPDMDDRIVNDLIIAGCVDSEHWAEINNKCGPGRAMSAAVGILFDRPESVRRAIEGFEALMDHSFHFDGFCEESPSYSGMHLNLMRNIPEILLGYSDPAGYRAADGSRLDNYDPFTEMDRYRLALESMVRMLDFDNRFPVIGDTHFGSGIDPIYAEILTAHYGDTYAALLAEAQGAPLSEKGSEYALWHRPPDVSAARSVSLPHYSEWFPGWHVGVLRGGASKDRTAFYFNGYAHGGHRHYDTLGIAFLACGKELASDRGYIWDDPRNAWTKSTMSHNLVIVDGENQNGDECHSTLELFGTAPFVEIVRASANAYTQCDKYERTCALVEIPGGGWYAVDIFRIRGGHEHRYSLNCNGRLIATRGVETQPVDDENKWLENFRAGTPDGAFSATWEYEGTKVDMVMLNPVDRLIVADAPGWRNNRGEALDAPPIQQIFAERRDNNRAESVYAVVMAPYEGTASPLKSVRAEYFDFDTGTVAVAVEREGGTDYIVSAGDRTERRYGPVTMAGTFGLTTVDLSGRLTRAYLLDGTLLECGGKGIRLDAATISLNVSRVEGRTFHLAEFLHGSLDLKGKYILAGETGFEIESHTGSSITVRDYPAIGCENITIINSGVYER